MKLLAILLLASFVVLFTVPAYAEDIVIPESLSGTFYDSDISLVFSNGTVSGTITTEDGPIAFNSLNVIERSDRFFIFDKSNDLKIVSKQLDSEKYIVIAKLGSDTKLRFITNSTQPNSDKVVIKQRNLFDEQTITYAKQQEELAKAEAEKLSAKDIRIQKEEQKLAELLKKLEQEEKAKTTTKLKEKANSEKTWESILAAYEKSKIKTGPDLVTHDKKTTTKKTNQTTTPQDKNIKLHLSVSPNVRQGEDLRYSVLVTDDIRGKYNTSYETWTGNPIMGINMTGKIINPANIILHTFNGTSDENGIYISKFLMPANALTWGQSTISFNATNTLSSGSPIVSANQTFYVFEVQNNDNDRTNKNPILAPIEDQNGNVGKVIKFNLNVTNSDEIPSGQLSFLTDDSAPAGVNLDETTGAFDWNPSANQTGTHILKFSATNNISETKILVSNIKKVTFTINP